MRLLVLTAGFGDGHNTAARNVALALAQVTEGRAECRVHDAIARGNPLAARLLQGGYQFAITTLPAVWRAIYRRTERLDVTHPPVEIFNGILDWLEAEMTRFRPEAIVSTYPLYASLVRRIDAFIPVYTVITDSITVHRSWTTTPSTLHFVSDPRSKQVAEGFGLQPASVRVTGFPVSPEFMRHPVIERRRLRRLLWFVGTGGGHVLKSLRSLLAALPDSVSFTLLLGRHASRLRAPVERELARRGGRRRVRVLAWCDDVPGLLREHDCVLTKAGGATTHECFAAAIPMAINYVVPGQEEGNAQLALESGGALRIHHADETGPLLRSLMESGDFGRLAHCMAGHATRDGAVAIAAAIIAARGQAAGAESARLTTAQPKSP